MCVSFRINFYILLIIFKAFNGCALTSYVPGRSLSSPLVTKGDRGNTVPPHDMLQSVFMLYLPSVVSIVVLVLTYWFVFFCLYAKEMNGEAVVL